MKGLLHLCDFTPEERTRLDAMLVERDRQIDAGERVVSTVPYEHRCTGQRKRRKRERAG